mgnify:CR=1 FL=1
MQDKKIILTKAKLNIFLNVLRKRTDGYHEIRTGITFINLFDKIEIQHDSKNSISYSGSFQPENNKYDDCIIKKTFDFLKINKKNKFKIKITKNIPVQGGLGSASTNAAAIIKALEEMNIIEKRKPEYYVSLGSDIPCFLFNNDCLAMGIGEKLISYSFPKYFFLLIKPTFTNSTKKMYENLKIKNNLFLENLLYENNIVNENDKGNDFEKILLNQNKEYKKIFNYLESLEKVIFVRMTGSGSCCYAAFEKKSQAVQALLSFKSKFPNLWSINCENNTINI